MGDGAGTGDCLRPAAMAASEIAGHGEHAKDHLIRNFVFDRMLPTENPSASAHSRRWCVDDEAVAGAVS